LIGSIVAVAFVAAPVSAENPGDLLPEIADDGIYIAPSRSSEAAPSDFVAVIEEARGDGVQMAVLYPEDPQPNTGAFARRMQEASGLDVVVVFGPEGAFGSFVSEDFGDGAIRAAAAARELSEPTAKVEAFVTGLLEEPVRERPEIIDELVRWIIILMALLVTGAMAEQLLRRLRRQRKLRRLQARQDA